MRNVTEIKVWMIRQGIREIDIVRETGQDQTYVNKTLMGLRNNKAVLRYLFNKGCPVKHLALPKKLSEELLP